MTEQHSLSSPSSRLMGVQTIDYDAETGIATMHCTAPEEFASPRGYVQGGLIGGFLDEVMGAAAYGYSSDRLLPLNLDMNISFVRPVPIGRLVAKGKVVKIGSKVAFLEGELQDMKGVLLARATTTAILTEVPDGKA